MHINFLKTTVGVIDYVSEIYANLVIIKLMQIIIYAFPASHV